MSRGGAKLMQLGVVGGIFVGGAAVGAFGQQAKDWVGKYLRLDFNPHGLPGGTSPAPGGSGTVEPGWQHLGLWDAGNVQVELKGTAIRQRRDLGGTNVYGPNDVFFTPDGLAFLWTGSVFVDLQSGGTVAPEQFYAA